MFFCGQPRKEYGGWLPHLELESAINEAVQRLDWGYYNGRFGEATQKRIHDEFTAGLGTG